MPIETITIDKPLIEVGCTLGEGPVYDAMTSTLHFVDIIECKVYHLNTRTNEFTNDEYPVSITSLALRSQDPKDMGFAATTEHGFALLKPHLEIEYLARPLPPAVEGLSRFNDGACDSRGRYFAGTIYSPEHGIAGKLYRYDPANGSCVVVDEGPFTDSNGLGWSPDEKLFYFTDTWKNIIYVYDYDIDTGNIRNRRVFVDANELGYGSDGSACDGLCLDTEGGIWNARWCGSRIIRYNSEGTPDLEIVFPKVWKVTSCCFGGPDLDQLYVTSASCASVGGDASKQLEFSQSGHVFVVDLHGRFRGAPRYSFSN
ncbi:hypothetical protein PM082_002889 [Marasmius tenuissimus]|nr:hypothetical protein PM082_002889 [Marasmius tenuissimus]